MGRRNGNNDKTMARGGIGKGLLARALARGLYPDIENDEDIYFSVGSLGVAFDGYDGQPVIIWHDRRAFDLINELGGRGTVFDIFDTHPDPVASRRNIKYGSVVLTHSVNIVDGIEGYETFLDSLAGDYTDKSGQRHYAEDTTQSYRRFPFIIPIHEHDFEIMLNQGFIQNTQALCHQYKTWQTVRGNMQRAAAMAGDDKALAVEGHARMIAPIVEKSEEIRREHDRPKMDRDAYLIETFDYGLPADMPEAEVEERRSLFVADLAEARAAERAEAELEAMEAAEDEALEDEIAAYLARQSQAAGGDE